MKPNGYILSEDSERVVIATGFTRASNNLKTGDMVQIWILVRSENPLAAIRSGQDALICGNCPLRGDHGKKRACYVHLGFAPTQVWRAYSAGSYPKLPSYSLFANRVVRFGAYGDPVYIPFDVVASVARHARKWTGYTHQWRNAIYRAYSAFLMASVEDIDGTRLAHQNNWRTFRVSSVLAKLDNEIVCPNTTHGRTCEQCGLCNGSHGQKNILIESHGIGKDNVNG